MLLKHLSALQESYLHSSFGVPLAGSNAQSHQREYLCRPDLWKGFF